jgi:hypothetical protein
MHGFEVYSYTEIAGNSPNPDMLYVILPDMHLPGIPHNKEFRKKTNEELRAIWTNADKVLKHKYVSVERREKIMRFSEYKRGKEADIFGEAEESLCSFLDWVQILALGKLDGKLKIIHVGDMYERWQGMGEWGSYFDGEPNNLVLEHDAEPKLCARGQGIEDQNAKLMVRFKQLDDMGVTDYVYGNHDVYLDFFSIFVMGHTHIPDLWVLKLYRKPGEIPDSFCLDCLPKDSDTYQRYNR